MTAYHRPLKLILFGAALIAAFVALLLSTTHVSAFPLGVTGRSGNPATNGGATCSMCHSGGDKPTVTLIGPSTVQPGETNQYTLRIAGGPAKTGGFNVSTTAGVIASLGGDTQILDGEITHTSPKDFSGSGALTFTFNWTAPSTPGAVSMYGAGNSSNGDFDTTGDGIGAASVVIKVAAPSGGGGATPAPGTCVIPTSGPWPPCATGGGGGAPAPGECVIPTSGPWPPCATGGGGTAPAPGDCVIPASGPWPPCATGGASPAPGGCVIPASGPWPPCATGGSANPGGDCVIPASGPWPPCARTHSLLLY